MLTFGGLWKPFFGILFLNGFWILVLEIFSRSRGPLRILVHVSAGVVRLFVDACCFSKRSHVVFWGPFWKIAKNSLLPDYETWRRFQTLIFSVNYPLLLKYISCTFPPKISAVIMTKLARNFCMHVHLYALRWSVSIANAFHSTCISSIVEVRLWHKVQKQSLGCL